MSDRLLTIGELARRAGVATSALRYYEELGLLPAPARISGQRRYPESAAWLIGVILLLRDVGFSLAEQKAFMASRAAAPRDWRRLAPRKLAALAAHIAQTPHPRGTGRQDRKGPARPRGHRSRAGLPARRHPRMPPLRRRHRRPPHRPAAPPSPPALAPPAPLWSVGQPESKIRGRPKRDLGA